MVRPSRRKAIEEVYGSKLEPIHPAKSQTISHATTKTAQLRTERSNMTGPGNASLPARVAESRTHRSYVTANDYYITTNLPLTSTNLRNAPAAMASQAQANVPSSSFGGSGTRRAAGGSAALGVAAGKHSVRQLPQTKSVFTRSDSKAASSILYNKSKEPHGHNHAHGMKHLTQRVVYANPSTDLSDKEMPPNGSNMGRRNIQPLQHQLHQQQQSIQPLVHQHKHQHNHSHPHHQHAHQRAHGQGHSQPQAHHGPPKPHSHIDQVSQDETEEDEKDDDPEEFLELIRQTVQTAIGSTVSDVLSRNFRDLGTKIEKFSNDLKTTNEHLDKLEDHVTNKVVHYGEENSRHFRYLCMKSEYDKMFYQHSNLMASTNPHMETLTNSQHTLNNLNSVSNINNINTNQSQVQGPTRSQILEQNLDHGENQSKHAGGYNMKYAMKHGKHSLVSERRKSNGKHEHVSLSNEGSKVQNPCACRSTPQSAQQPEKTESHKSCSEQSLGMKSSESGMREVLGHIQRFCTQVHDLKTDQGQYNTKELLSNLEGIVVAAASSGNGGGSAVSAPAAAAASKRVDGAAAVKSRYAAHKNFSMVSPMDSLDEDEYNTDSHLYANTSEDDESMRSDDSDMKFPSSGRTARANTSQLNKRVCNKGAGDGH